MITRFPGLTPTRSRAVATDDLVVTVAVAPDPVTPDYYEQAVKVLARIDESLALCGTDKSKILSAIIYIADVKQKAELNRAWDEWVDQGEPADARLHRGRHRAAASGRDRGDGGEVADAVLRWLDVIRPGRSSVLAGHASRDAVAPQRSSLSLRASSASPHTAPPALRSRCRGDPRAK